MILCWENKTRKKLTFEFEIEKQMASSFSLRAFSVDQYYVADFVFLEQHKSLLTDFNGRIAQNCCLCSYTKINENTTTVLLSLPSCPFSFAQKYMYVETHASPLRVILNCAQLCCFFLRWKAGAISFSLDKNQNILGNLTSHIRTVQKSRIIMIIKTLMNFRFVCFDGWMRPFLFSTKIAGFGLCGASYGKQVPPSSVT